MPPFRSSGWDLLLSKQPKWRRIYLEQDDIYKIYAETPLEIQSHPLFYPTQRRWTWEHWEKLHKEDLRVSYNFPVLPVGSYDLQAKFRLALINLLEAWNLIPDPAIVVTCRFIKLVLLLTKLPNYNDLECSSMRQNFDLSIGPNVQQIEHYYHKVKYLPSNYLQTFEDIFDTKFWEVNQAVHYHRHTPNPLSRYEMNFPDKTLRKQKHPHFKDIHIN